MTLYIFFTSTLYALLKEKEEAVVGDAWMQVRKKRFLDGKRFLQKIRKLSLLDYFGIIVF